MIRKLYEEGYFQFQKFILDNAKALALTPEESVVLIKILEEYPRSKSLSGEALSENIALTKAKMDKALASLLERGFYEIYIHYEDGIGREYICVDGFFAKVQNILGIRKEDFQDELYRVNQYLTKEMNRILTSKELEILSSLVLEERHTLADIERVCEALKKKGKIITMRALAQGLSVKDEPQPVNPSSKVVQDFFKSIK